MKKSVTALAILLALGAAAPIFSQSLDRTKIGPGDRPEAILTMAVAGRVSIRATSPLGVGFSLHGRQEGLIYRSGSSGQSDGRIDASLDPGSYKIRLEGIEAAGGDVGLSVGSYGERNGDRPGAWPRLVGGQTLSASLSDLESASFWLELREDGPLELEALGRDLSLMEVWREGQYIVGTWKPREEVQVETGKPMGWICASKALKAGSYLVKVYGGPPRAWAKEDGSHPLHLRSGFLGLPVGGMMDLRLSPFGRDFILVDGMRGASISRNDKVDTKVAAGAYRVGGDRLSTSDSDSIGPRSQSPWCAVDLPRGQSLITVRGVPGDSLRLDAWSNQGSASFDAPRAGGGGLLSIIGPRTGEAELEPTGLVYRQVSTSGAGRRTEILRDFCPPLSGKDSLRRRANLLQAGNLSMYLRVDEAGPYRIFEKTGLGQAKALYSIVPLDAAYAPGRQSYEAGPDRAAVNLTKGYHLLRIQARDLGILDFVIVRDGPGQNGRDGLAADPAPARTSLAWVLGAAETASGFSVLLGQRGSAPSGSDFRPFPLASPAGIALDLGPRQELSLPLDLAAPSRIAELSPGLASDTGALAQGRILRPGKLVLSLSNPGQATLRTGLRLEENYADLPEDRITAFGSGLPGLSPGHVLWGDFQRGESLFAALEVKTGSVYALESLGRLSTSLVLRSATREKILEAKANGYGRNAAIRAYLGPGQYYLELRTEGRSAGRGGLGASAVPEASRLGLAPGVVDRRRVPADSMLHYAFLVEGAGRYRFSSIGIGSSYAIRIEDGDGFPLYNGGGDTSLSLDPGSYALYSLPLSIETRRVTAMAAIPEQPGVLQGRGPRSLEFNRKVQAIWTEGGGDDSYTFTSPSDLAALILLPKGFSGRLEGAGASAALVEGENEVELRTGAYTLSLRPREKTGQLAYGLSLSTSVLAPGLSLSQSLDTGKRGEMAVSLPRDGFYELWSQGQNDLAADLVSAAGQVVASSDDNGADWNIDISQGLPGGAYTLRTRSLAGGGRSSVFRLEERRPRTGPRLSTSGPARLDLDGDGVMLALDGGAPEGLYVIEAQGGRADLRLYRGSSLLAQAEGRIAIPLGKGGNLRLYATSPSPIQVSLGLRRLGEKSSSSLSAAQVLEAGEARKVLNPEALSARLGEGRILVSPGLDSPCEDPGSEAFSVGPEGGWLWAPDARARIEPLALSPEDRGGIGLAGLDQGFTLASGKDEVLLLRADTRGAFRAGLSAIPAGTAGPAPRDWWVGQAWSSGSLALLPPGAWKARLWDGEAGPGLARRLGYALEAFPLQSRRSLPAGARQSLALPPGSALALDIPASRVEALLGEDLVIAAWKDGKALGGCNSLDGRQERMLDLPASTLYVVNTGRTESQIRIGLLPSQPPLVIDRDRPWEARAVGPEGIEAQVQAQAGEVLCVAGTAEEMELSGNDGSFKRIEGTRGLWRAIPSASGRLFIGRSEDLVRVWLARPGQEMAGLTEDLAVMGAGATGAAGCGAATQGLPELKGVQGLPGKAGAYRLSLQAPGFVDLSAPGPGVIAISGKGLETRASLGRDGEDVHLFAWLPAGDYRVWQRPGRGGAGGGWLRASKVEAGKIASAEEFPGGLIAPGEFQAWSFHVQDDGLVGLGVKADRDGLGLLLYDSGQGLLASGTLILEQLEAGDYLAVVRGLAEEPSEYRLVVEGAFGSRDGVPQDTIEAYRKAGGKPSPSIGIPLHGRGARGAVLEAGPEDGEDREGDYPDDTDEGDTGDYPSEEE